MNWNRWYRLVSYSRSSLWIVPVFAVIVEQFAIRLTSWADSMLDWNLYAVGADGATAILNAIITLTLSFVVFTFGSMLVAIQVAGGQLTSRIIATTLLRDNVVRGCVGLFTFTLVYAMGSVARIDTNVNQLGVAISAIAAFSCIAGFLYLIDYAARLLRPITIMARVGEQGLTVIETVYTRARSKAPPQEKHTLPSEARQVIIHQGTSGIVLAVNKQLLLAEAERFDCTIEVVPYVGDFVAVDEPLFRIYDGVVTADDGVRAAVALGSERTLEQDPMFAFRILVDIALRALSKAINDPTTAVLAIDQLTRLLRMVGRRHTMDEYIQDASGKLRVVWHTPNWEDYVHLAIAEIRLNGAESLQIARRLRAMIENLTQTLSESRHPPLLMELDLLDRTVERAYAMPEDIAMARVADSQGLGASGSGQVRRA